MVKPKRKMDSEKSRKYWQLVDDVVASINNENCEVTLNGDPWTDSPKDLSASLVKIKERTND